VVNITLSDLRFRARQFVIATIGAGLAFAMTLLLAGLAGGFTAEIDQTVSGLGATNWVVKAGSAGRIASLGPMSQTIVPQVAHEPGVVRAVPVAIVPQTAQLQDKSVAVTMIGVGGNRLVSVPLSQGHQVTGSGQAVVDARLKVAPGAVFTVNGRLFRVVGVTTGRTLFGGQPDAYVTLGDLQASVFEGQHLIDAVLTQGRPQQLPPGLVSYTEQQVEKATISQMGNAVSSINNSKYFMWLVAAIIVASLIYVTALERKHDFAVLKALGASSPALFAGLALEAVAVTLVAAAFGATIAQFMSGIFQQPVDIPSNAYVVLPLSAVAVGLLASLSALRRAVSADPAAALAG
jgi:putative ABC transport system permease protein